MMTLTYRFRPYAYRHGHNRAVGLRGAIEITLITPPEAIGLGIAFKRYGQPWRTRYAFASRTPADWFRRRRGFSFIGW